MNDKSTAKYINLVPEVEWTTDTEYVHYKYKWIVRRLPESNLECQTYQNDKIVRRNLLFNETVVGDCSSNAAGGGGSSDGAGGGGVLNHIYNQTITSIPRCTIVGGDVIFAPLATTWAQIIVDDRIRAIVLSYYNNVVKISEQCTFDSRLSLPFGLPLFDSALDRIVGFVGRRLPNGRYVVDADSHFKIHHHVSSREKVSIDFRDVIVEDKKRQTEIARRRVDLFGNRTYENGLKTYELRQLETTNDPLDVTDARRINVLQTENGVVITFADEDKPDAAQLQKITFKNNPLVKYFSLPPIEEFVVDEDDIVGVNKKKKK